MPLRILIVEDSPADAELIGRALVKDGLEINLHRVETEAEMRAALAAEAWDVLILDFNLPTFDALAALGVLGESGHDIPAIVVSGSVGEDVAVETMRAGATDYVMKDNLTRLAPAVKREIRDAAIRQRQARAEADVHLLGTAIDAASIGITIGDAQAPGVPLTRINRAFSRITGYAESEIVGRSCNILQGAETDPETVQRIRAALQGGRQFNGVILNYRKDGRAFWNHLTIAPVRDEVGRLTHFVGLQVDVSEQKDMEDHLAWVETHDTLTGLPNLTALRRELVARIRALAHGKQDRIVAVIVLDLDRFSQLNDSLGREVCDGIIVEVADRLQSAMPTGALLARTGADDFTLAFTATRGHAELEEVLMALHAAVSAPYKVAQLSEPLRLTVSSGLAFADSSDSRGEELISHAGAAMLRSRAAGRDQHHFYSPDMTSGATRSLSLEGALRQAIATGQLTLHYQPQVRLQGGGVDVVEALVRWRHPQLGLISPADFIPLAEDTGLIVPLGEWVLNEAVQQAARWRANGTGALRVAVNLSVQQLQQGYIVDLVRRALATAAVGADALELEITESQLMNALDSKQRILDELDEMGVLVAIDDFGTGYSSLAYLARLAVDSLKIDRSFVRDVETDRNAAAIISSVIALAHGLDLGVVAEGVETETQRQLLADMGCDLAQGYLFCKPVPADECGAFVRKQRQG